MSDKPVKYRMRISDGLNLVVAPRTHYGCGHPLVKDAPRCFCMWPRSTKPVVVMND